MRSRFNYKMGDKIGNCIFLEEIFFPETKRIDERLAKFECFCGKVFQASIYSVKREHTKSCGCLRDSKIKQQGFKNKKHGYRGSALYGVWYAMLRRCNNIKCKEYKNYGERGIKVCEQWYNINNFINDMHLSYKDGLQLDRINNDENYCPENCRWATRKENNNNNRRNRYIEYQGITRTLSEWADFLDFPYYVLAGRLKRKSVEESFSRPYKKYNVK